MKSLLLIAAGLVAAVAPAAAQTFSPIPEEPGAPFSVTTYTGVRVPYTAGFVSIFGPEGEFVVREERGGNPVLGAEGRVRVSGPVSLLVGGTYSRAGEIQFFLSDTIHTQPPDWISTSSDAMWFGKAGVSMRVEVPRGLADTRRRPATELFAAMAGTRQFGTNHPALNFGFQGAFFLSEQIEIVLGLEDYFVFWDNSALEPTLANEVLAPFLPEGAVQDLEFFYDTSNILHLQLGVAIRP